MLALAGYFHTSFFVLLVVFLLVFLVKIFRCAFSRLVTFLTLFTRLVGRLDDYPFA